MKMKWKTSSSRDDLWSCLVQIKFFLLAEIGHSLIGQIFLQLSSEMGAIVKRTQREYIVDS